MSDPKLEETAKEWLTGLGHFKIGDIARLTTLLERVEQAQYERDCEAEVGRVQEYRQNRDSEWVKAVEKVKRKALLSVAMSPTFRDGRLDALDEILREMGVKGNG